MSRVAIDATGVPPQATGVGRYAKDLIAAIAAIGDRPEIQVMATAATAGMFSQVGASGYRVVPASPSWRPLRLLYQESRLGELAKRSGSQVFHGLHYQLPKPRRGLRMVSTIHDLTFIDHPEWHEAAKVRYFTRAIRLAVARADHLIVPSTATGDRLLQLFPGAPPVTVVYHGVGAALVPEYGGTSRDEVEICFLGTIEPRKNLPRLLEAFDMVVEEHPQFRLRVVGHRGWKTAAFDAALERLRHRERVAVEGYLNEAELKRALKRARVLAYPSLEEGFGLPVLEALATGLNVVTSNVSATAEVAGGFAWLVDPGDVDSIAAGIVQAATSVRPADEVQRQTDWARSFTWEKAALATVAVYQRLLAP